MRYLPTRERHLKTRSEVVDGNERLRCARSCDRRCKVRARIYRAFNLTDGSRARRVNTNISLLFEASSYLSVFDTAFMCKRSRALITFSFAFTADRRNVIRHCGNAKHCSAQLPTKWGNWTFYARVDARIVSIWRTLSINYVHCDPPISRRQVASVINAIAIINTGRNNTTALLLQLSVKAYRGLKSVSSFPPLRYKGNKCKIILT